MALLAVRKKITPRDLFEGRVIGQVQIVTRQGAVVAPQVTPARGSPATAAAQPRGRGGSSYAKKGGSQLEFIRLMQSGGLGAGSPGRRKVPLVEVQQHKSAEDAWTVIDGRVFNITPYLDYHPGGASELMRGAGNDCSALFKEVHHWVSVDMLDQLQIGTVDVTNASIVAAPPANGSTGLPALHPSQWREFPLIRSEWKSKDALMLRFDIGGQRQLGLRPAQHLKIRMRLPKGQQLIEVQREYTPVSDPDALGFVQLLVKVYPSGRMGPALAKLKPCAEDYAGDHLEMLGPFGDLVYLMGGRFELAKRQVVARHVVMVAAGSGVTPMLQLLRVMITESRGPGPGPRATLIFCNRCEEDILLRDGLEKMAEGESKWFQLFLVLSQPPVQSRTWHPHQRGVINGARNLDGHVSEEVLSQALADEAADAPPDEDDPAPLVLCCGPEGFNKSCYRHSTSFRRSVVPGVQILNLRPELHQPAHSKTDDYLNAGWVFIF